MVCSSDGRSKYNATASSSITTPPIARTLPLFLRKNFTRSEILAPANANTSNGAVAPIAKDTVRATVSTPIFPLAAAIVIAVRTGPAHGTYNSPSPSPRPKPPPLGLTFRCGSFENGFSSKRSSGGISRLSPTTDNTTSPTIRRMSSGRFSALISNEPSRVKTVKLSTSPPITA